MKVFIAILGGIIVLPIVLFLCAVAATIRAEMYKECPLRKECNIHRRDGSFAHKCCKHRTTFPHNSIDNSL